MPFFEKSVDKRSKEVLREFLRDHFRHSLRQFDASYANCVKVHRLGLTPEQMEAAWEMLATEYWSRISDPMDEFTLRHRGHYTIASGGRSSGYLVLYSSRYEETGHKSYCRRCGQRNFLSVAEMPTDPQEAVIAQEVLKSHRAWIDEVYLKQSAIAALDLGDEAKLEMVARFKKVYKEATMDNRCGVCGEEGFFGRANFEVSPKHLKVYPRGVTIEDLQELSLADLRSWVELIQDFDRTCDEVRDNFIELLDNCEVVEETIMVPKTVKRLVCMAD